MSLPWWAKIAAKLILARLPFGYAAWQRIGWFRHGCMDSSEYALAVFERHVARAGYQHSLRGRTVLELGPGDSIATAIIAAAHGARAILVDAGRFARKDMPPYVKLASVLADRGLHPPDIEACRDLDEILERCDASYLTGGLEGFRRIGDGTVDLVFSQAVLEHVRKKEFPEMMRECRRILKPDGACSHQVDLRDHLDGALNNLRFSDRAWESEIVAGAGFYTNRIGCAAMCELFERAGFDVQLEEVCRWERLPTPRERLARQFRAIPEEELLVSGFAVLLRQKQLGGHV